MVKWRYLAFLSIFPQVILNKNTYSYVNMRHPIEPMQSTTIFFFKTVGSPKIETHKHERRLFYPQIKIPSQERNEAIPKFADFYCLTTYCFSGN